MSLLDEVSPPNPPLQPEEEHPLGGLDPVGSADRRMQMQKALSTATRDTRPKPVLIDEREKLQEMQRGLKVYGVSKLSSPRQNTMYIGELQEIKWESMVMTVERFIELKQQLVWHGCLTGDCPHGTQAECDKSLADYLRGLAKELDP